MSEMGERAYIAESERDAMKVRLVAAEAERSLAIRRESEAFRQLKRHIEKSREANALARNWEAKFNHTWERASALEVSHAETQRFLQDLDHLLSPLGGGTAQRSIREARKRINDFLATFGQDHVRAELPADGKKCPDCDGHGGFVDEIERRLAP
jgi:hypothetical protein